MAFLRHHGLPPLLPCSQLQPARRSPAVRWCWDQRPSRSPRGVDGPRPGHRPGRTCWEDRALREPSTGHTLSLARRQHNTGVNIQQLLPDPKCRTRGILGGEGLPR